MTKNPFFRFIFISCISTSILFVALEFLLRESVTSFRSLDDRGWLEASPELLIKYTGNGRRLVPNASVVVKNHYLSEQDVLIETNEKGFRAQSLPAVKADNETRILALGDSITIGDYFPIEKVFTWLLETKLQADFPDRVISVTNAGVMDIGLKEEIEILKETGLSIAPDIVLVNFYLNDSRPSWGFAGETRHRGWIRRHSVAVEFLYNQLKLMQWVSTQGTDRFTWIETKETLPWKNEREAFKQLVIDARYDWGSAWDQSSWDEMMPYFTELKELSEAHQFKVVLAAFPVRYQVYSQVADAAPQERLKTIADSFGFTLVDLLPALTSAGKNNPDLFYDQCHPTEEGYQVIANTLVTPVTAQLTPINSAS